jgi:hypothetical protein
MEGHREQRASKILRFVRNRDESDSTAKRENGEGRSQHYQDFGGLVEDTYVFAAKHSERPSITVPEGTG